MVFLRDPVWQFIGVVVTLISILVALLALISPLVAGITFIISVMVLLLSYTKVRPEKTLFFRTMSDTVVLSIREEEEVEGEIKILYRDQEVKEDIHLVIVKLWNASNNPILPEEYKSSSIKMNFGAEAEIFSAQVLESAPPTIKEEINDNKLLEFSDGKVNLKPIWLNKDNSLMLKVLLSKFQGDIEVDETRIIVGGYVRNWNKSNFSKIKNFADKYGERILAISALPIIFVTMGIAVGLVSYYTGVNADKFSWWLTLIALGIAFISALVIFFLLGFVYKRFYQYINR